MLQEAINDEANLRNESQRSNMTGIQKQRKENENENAVVWRICSILRTKIAYLEYQVLLKKNNCMIVLIGCIFIQKKVNPNH